MMPVACAACVVVNRITAVPDAYGPTVAIGGGAWSGKDFWKVDRRGGLLARAMAQRLVEDRGCDEARVSLEYYPGSDAPAYGEAIVDGRRLALDCRALTGAAVVPRLQAIFTPPKSSGREFDLKEAARWGHHGLLEELQRNFYAKGMPLHLGSREPKD
jgi:S-adenosylmethionine synthetase